MEIFHDLDEREERALLSAAMAWQREKYDAGYGALTWPVEDGGAGLPAEYAEAFAELEAEYETPPLDEIISVTIELAAPTVALFAPPPARAELLSPLLRTDLLCCQMFSEPGAGSDLAAVATRAVRDGDTWSVTGQKIWSSGARHATWGLLLARTDLDVPKHAGITAFLVRIDAPGVTVRPIRQMSGGASFNEVFLDDVPIPDRYRLGEIGQGWRVALTTLGFERGASGTGRGGHVVGGSFEQLAELARWTGRADDPIVRQQLARIYSVEQVRTMLAGRAAARAAAGQPAGPEASIGKLLWTQSMTRIGELAGDLLGARLIADSGEWGTFAWSRHVLGAPGYRIAGGTDEVQRDIVAHRVLGLPTGPRVDRDVPFRQVLR